MRALRIIYMLDPMVHKLNTYRIPQVTGHTADESEIHADLAEQLASMSNERCYNEQRDQDVSQRFSVLFRERFTLRLYMTNLTGRENAASGVRCRLRRVLQHASRAAQM